jgi:hypothetical protein
LIRQQQAEEQGLNAAKTDAFSQIETAANRRGVFYGGMPIAEEQRYTGAQFLPSVANLRSKYAQQKFDLTSALNKVTSDEYNNANGIHQNELDLEEKQREFDRQLAAKQAAAGLPLAGSASPSFRWLWWSKRCRCQRCRFIYSKAWWWLRLHQRQWPARIGRYLFTTYWYSLPLAACNRWPKLVILALNKLLAMLATTTVITRYGR